MADEKVLITESTLDNIGEAIREKNGESDLYYPREMPAAIRRIRTGSGGGSIVAVYPILVEGEHIADIVVDGERYNIYAPEQITYVAGDGIEISGTSVSVSESLRRAIAGKVDTDALETIVTNLNAAIAGKQDTLVAGQNITIQGNVISVTGGGSGDIITISQAEYDALPAEEKLDLSKVYFIPDGSGGGGGGSVSVDETDLWTNTNGTATGTFTLSDSIDNYDFIIFYYGLYSEYGSGTLNISDYRIVSVDDLNELYANGTRLLLTGWSNRTVYVSVHEDSMSIPTAEYSQVMLKVRGVKVSGGGSGGGSSSDDYSTTEQVVGTWIDDKPIYRKTFEVNFHTNGLVWVDTGCVIDNIETIVDYSITANDTYVGGAPANCTIAYFRYNNSNIQIYVNNSWYLDVHTITVKYTKTTD